MKRLWKRSVPRVLCACAALAVLARPAAANPMRLIVDFTVEGDARLDPDFGHARGSGSFDVVADLKPDSRITKAHGFGAELVDFRFAGTTWTRAHADVFQLGLGSDGRVQLWNLSGVVRGDGGGLSFLAFPDFSATFCKFCNAPYHQTFDYTTFRSPTLGIFQGGVTSFKVTTLAATPEPASALLLGTGAILFAAIRRRRR